MLTPQQQAAANLQQQQTLKDAGVLNSSGNFTETPSVRAMRKIKGFVSRKAAAGVRAVGNVLEKAIDVPFGRLNKVITVDSSQRSRRAAAKK